MKKIFYTALFALFLLSANAQAPAIVFLQADANVDCYEFITLRRASLNAMSIRDAGICSDGKFRTNESDILSFSGPSFIDVPAGTIIQVKNANPSQDSSVADGHVLLVDNLALNNTSTNPPGDQVIAYTGPAIGSVNCAGATGSNTFVSGFDWGNAGWTSGATSSNDSKAPGTPYDFAFPGNTFNKVQFSGSIVGNEAALVAYINNTANWTGATTGDGVISLKDILFDESNYTSGAAVVTPATTSATLDLSSLVFGNTTTDTRYVLIISNGGAPTLPVDRYTCYAGIVPTVVGAPSVVASVSGQTATDFCGVVAQGTGQIVYFDYTLPSSLTITGLAQNASYQYAVVAVNGNGYTANYSSTAYTGSFTTGVPVSTVVEISAGSEAATVNENVGQVLVPVTITNPSPSVATTVDVVITGGTGSAADVNNFTTQTLTFPAGSSASQNIVIDVTDDLLQEPTETVAFTLQNVGGGQGTATIGTNNIFTLTITDNDAPVADTEVNFTTVPTSVIENVGQVGAVLTITNPSPLVATTVEVQITGGTGSAADVDNYVTQTVTFPAGSSSLEPISIFVTDDGLFEADETVSFAIRNISGGQGNAVIGADSTFTLTIIDNDVPNLVINEIHYNPAEVAGSPDADYEFIEIYNAEPVTVDISDYYFSQGVDFTFAQGTTIDPAEYLIVAINANTFSGQGYDVYQWNSGDLDNNGETIEIKTHGSLLVDYVTYGVTAPWPTQPNNQGPSLQLIATNLDNALPESWYGNGPKNGTPGHPNSPVGINEELAGYFNVFGNGNNLYVKVDPKMAGTYTVNLLNITGQKLGTFANLSGSQNIETGAIANGIYIIQLINNEGIFVNKKIHIAR